MELKLYNYLRSEGLINDIVDFRDKNWQEKLERYDSNLGLDVEVLSSIQKQLKVYNEFLKSQKKTDVKLRYYQILSLYFSKLYFNLRHQPDFQYSQNNLAYWMATGSGKTIIMHLNILQYLNECNNFKNFEIIMTTPGVNLIEQHERELIPFIEYLNQRIFKNKISLIIDTTQSLNNRPNDFFTYPKSDAYKRLILVDEAHIGLSTTGSKGTDGAFMELRRRLNINESLLIEYSATFHNINNSLEMEYEKSIVYDYNYNHFYRDGYGKDYFFQQIGDDVLEKSFDDNLHRNLWVINDKIQTWSNLDYSKQKDLFSTDKFPDKPLIAFMGNTVNNKADSNKNKDNEVSDITKIIDFLSGLSEKSRQKYSHIFNNEYSGRLTLTKNPDAEDEILLSYGNGDFWGIVNVGNGAKFINELSNDNVIKNSRESIIISNIDKYSFKNIDSKESPINILIGSRKFAEGWNCFRVSVIGLINLGSSKGNKIIQIFGRGVRIKGSQNDGKRTFPLHNDNYFELDNRNEEDKIRKIETLCIFSLKKSYLETFTSSVTKEFEIQKKYEVKVNPSIIKLSDNTEVIFEEFRKDIPIFKLSKTEVGQKRVKFNSNQSFDIVYKIKGAEITGKVKRFEVQLNYCPDKTVDGVNIKGDLLKFLNEFGIYIDWNAFDIIVNEFQYKNSLHISSNNKRACFDDLLGYVGDIIYKSEISTLNIDFIQNLVLQITKDLLNKLKNKINWYINNSNYEYSEPLKQSTELEKGDFIDKYYILQNISSTKEQKGKSVFKKQSELNDEVEYFEKNIQDIAEKLMIQNTGNHIYSPLLRETNRSLESESSLIISPDKLNAGEKKFIEDATLFFSNSHYSILDKYQVYLMRNVESLKSIGIYLNDDTTVFYPDFVLWLIGEDTVYINFIDPKGQMGLQDSYTLLENEKVRIADKDNNDTLPILEKELSIFHKKNIILNSFILLRDSSEMGKGQTLDWKVKNMIDKHIFRLNWHEKNELGNTIDVNTLPYGKNYFDMIIDKVLESQ